MEALDRVIDQLQAVPHQKLVITFFYDGVRPTEDLAVHVRFVSLVPVIEAVGARMAEMRAQAFTPDGAIRNTDRVLDLHGLLLFLVDAFEAMRDAGHIIRPESYGLLLDAIEDLAPAVEEASR